MIYTSIDIESSGLESDKHCILSMGAIIEDTTKKLPFDEIPKFYGVIIQREIVGSPRALTINKDLISDIGDYIEGNDERKKFLSETLNCTFYEKDKIIIDFFDFLVKNNVDPNYKQSFGGPNGNKTKSGIMLNAMTRPVKINVAGKNYGTFDKLFLQELPWWKKLIAAKQRILDPAILCCNFNEDESLPNLDLCKQRLGISGEVSHNALDDAWDVIQVLRKYY